MLLSLKNKYPEYFFLLKLIFFFSIFYYGTEFWIGLTAKGGMYSVFCDEYLNYIKWLRVFILKGSGIICNAFGYNTTLEKTTSLRIIGGIKVNMVYSCIGFGVLSSWAAYVLAFPSNFKRKIVWLFSGTAIILFINMIRVAGLLMLINKTKNIHSFPNHHTVFNVVAYAIVVLLIYFYSKDNKLKTT